MNNTNFNFWEKFIYYMNCCNDRIYDDIEDYKYDDGEVLDYTYVRRCRGECCTVEVDVKSIYELDIFTDLMMNRSDTFMVCILYSLFMIVFISSVARTGRHSLQQPLLPRSIPT